MNTSLTTRIFVLALATLAFNNFGDGRKNQPYIVKRWYSLPGYSETPYDDCGSVGSTLKKVQVVPCDSEDVCILHRGADTIFKLSFVSKVNSTKLSTVVHGIVAGIPLPFHVPQVVIKISLLHKCVKHVTFIHCSYS